MQKRETAILGRMNKEKHSFSCRRKSVMLIVSTFPSANIHLLRLSVKSVSCNIGRRVKCSLCQKVYSINRKEYEEREALVIRSRTKRSQVCSTLEITLHICVYSLCMKVVVFSFSSVVIVRFFFFLLI